MIRENYTLIVCPVVFLRSKKGKQLWSEVEDMELQRLFEEYKEKEEAHGRDMKILESQSIHAWR